MVALRNGFTIGNLISKEFSDLRVFDKTNEIAGMSQKKRATMTTEKPKKLVIKMER